MFMFGILAALLAALVGFAFAQDRARDRRFEAVGARLGLRFERRGHEVARLRESLSRLPGMTRNARHGFFRVLHGPDAIVCDWRVLVRPKERPRRSTQTLVARSHSGSDLPSFRLVAAASSALLAEHEIGPRIEFEAVAAGTPARIAVAGPDAEGLRAFFSAERRSRIDVPEGLVVEAAGPWIACYRPGHKVATDELATFFERCGTLCDQLSDR